jgi:4a-hydroxytetrahydrobiopterin dehydratase
MAEKTRDLAARHCVPCRGGVPALEGAELKNFATEVPSWTIEQGHHIARSFTFPDFKTGLEFVNRVGAVAEREGHHPDICLTWGRVDVKTYTHKIDGLTESDFILAAKIDREFEQLSSNRS